MPLNDVLQEEMARQQRQVAATGGQMNTMGEQGQQPAASQGGQQPPQRRRAGGGRGTLSNVVQFEKTDIQFWMDVATLVVLVLILLRV